MGLLTQVLDGPVTDINRLPGFRVVVLNCCGCAVGQSNLPHYCMSRLKHWPNCV